MVIETLYDFGPASFKSIAMSSECIPDMYPEYSRQEQEYDERLVEIDLEKGVVRSLTLEEAKVLYPKIEGRSNRIAFWRCLRQLKMEGENDGKITNDFGAGNSEK